MSGKIAIVTGGSSGIGRAVCLLLGARGAAVVVPYAESVDGSSAPAERTVRDIVDNGGVAEAFAADLADVVTIRALFAHVRDQYGHIDVVVNCAAVHKGGALADITEADFDRTFGINAKGAFFVMQEAARHVADGGRIIVFSSPAARVGRAGQSAYGGSKAPVEVFARSLAWELGPRRITVNAVAPGATDTPMMTQEFREIGAKLSPFGRLGTAEDVAATVGWLASDEAAWITGQTIVAGGGAAMY